MPAPAIAISFGEVERNGASMGKEQEYCEDLEYCEIHIAVQLVVPAVSPHSRADYIVPHGG